MTAIDIYPISATLICTLQGYRSRRTGNTLLRAFKEAVQKENPKVYDYAVHHKLNLHSVVETIKRTHGITLFIPDNLTT